MSLTPARPPRLSVRGLSKAFGSNVVLDGVSFDVDPGEIVSLLGVNGAGKSTLIKIVCGQHRADGGELRLDDEPVAFESARAAILAGVRLVPQEVSVIPELSAAENVLLDRLPMRRRLGLPRLDRRAMAEEARDLLARAGLRTDPWTPVGRLSLQEKRLVEIARALAGEARLLVLDEPTASMTAPEAEELFANLRALAAQGTAIIYISHHLDEVFRLSDRVLVLKDGRLVGDHAAATADHNAVLLQMLGRPPAHLFPEAGDEPEPGASMLQVHALPLQGQPGALSFDLRRGEILGLFGLLGSGLEAVAPTLFAGRWTGTEALLGSTPLAATVAGRIAQGVGYLPAERKRDAVVPGMSIADNVAFPVLPRFSSALRLRRRAARADAEAKARVMQVRAQDVDQPLGQLSGGNQQKVCLARWIDPGVRLLVLEEPTRGVDVGARQDIYHAIRDLARGGVAVLILSSDVEEVAGLSDRMLVVRDGAAVRTFPRGTPAGDLMAAASGTTITPPLNPRAERRSA